VLELGRDLVLGLDPVPGRDLGLGLGLELGRDWELVRERHNHPESSRSLAR